MSGKKYHHYTHAEGSPDDALHAFVYALIAESVERMSGPAGLLTYRSSDTPGILDSENRTLPLRFINA